MGTDVHLISVGGSEAGLRRGADRIVELERTWSRFLEGSEVSRLNAAAGRPVILSLDTFALVQAAVAAWERTGGLFDPTVLTTLSGVGYDRSFDRIERDGPPLPAPTPAPGCAGIVMRPNLRLVVLPSDVGLDLGGIAKGLAADWVLEQLLEHSAGACVNLGGDLRVAGEPPSGDGWLVGVEDPLQGGEIMRLALAEGAVCTSSRLRRRWQRNGHDQHHIVDPRTGRPTRTPVVATTVIAGTAAEAEVLCKAVFLGGTRQAGPLLADAGAGALVVHDAGDVGYVGDPERFAA
jgi:FAD:protein FMN transferase